MKLRLVKSFDEGFKQLSSDMNRVKFSMTPFAMVHMHRVIMNFPGFIREWVLNDFSKRITFSFNFVHGSQNPQTIATCKSKSQGFLSVSMGTVTGNISVFLHCKKLKICLTTDKAAMEHP